MSGLCEPQGWENQRRTNRRNTRGSYRSASHPWLRDDPRSAKDGAPSAFFSSYTLSRTEGWAACHSSRPILLAEWKGGPPALSKLTMNYWRIRMNYSPTGEDVSKPAWEKGLIGIWYGAWTARDLETVNDLPPTQAAEVLASLPSQKRLNWKVTPGYIRTARRFRDISNDDWVFTYYEQALHLGQTASPILPEPAKEFERNGEVFKVRRVRYCKSFTLSELPESFRLLTCSGRSNIHQVPSTQLFVATLAASKNSGEVVEKFSRLDWREWLDALGPKGWEALCLGYLIQEVGYLPTGLGVGLTLPDFDIVGRDRDGRVVLAQCKKSPGMYRVSAEERATYRKTPNARVFLFAYAGAQGAPPCANVITAEDLQEWFTHSQRGIQYRQLLTGSKAPQ